MKNTDLTHTDLVEAAALMAERLLNSEHAVFDLSQRLAAAQGEVAALRGVLEYERQRAREFRSQRVYARPRSLFTRLPFSSSSKVSPPPPRHSAVCAPSVADGEPRALHSSGE